MIMLVKILYSFIVIIVGILYDVDGHTLKSSLAFVIDRTNSMQRVIDQVINETNIIFDAVLNSNSSVIEDFVLVVFDDPSYVLNMLIQSRNVIREPWNQACPIRKYSDPIYNVKMNSEHKEIELLANTTDRNQFRAALHSITLRNGCDCPEYSMSGIELALNVSRPNSFVYVFTNAFAKDYEKIDVVRSLSQEKGIQVNFLLTGKCIGDLYKRNPIHYDVYKDITKATSGQIFHSDKDDVNKIIKYIIETVKYKRTILKRKNTKEGENKIQFSVDSKIHNILIAVSPTPNYEVTDSDGNFIVTELIVQTGKSVVGKIIAKPGIYTVHINDYNQSTVVVSGETTVCFQYGFSTTEPTTLNETSTKPVDATGNQYLSIELDNFERDVYLETAELTDIDDIIIKVFNLKLINKEQQFYVTEPFKPPHEMFKIAINGLTKSTEKIRRVSTSTTQYQDPKLEPIPPYTPPTVTISPESPVYVEFNSLLMLKCRVRGYPEPDVKWMDDSGEILSAQKMYPVHLRRDYISVLEIEKANKNMTVTCKAVSDKGDEDSKSVDVKIKIKIYLKVIEHPKDKKVEYDKSAEFKCIVDSWPSAKIIWFKNEKIISTDENFIISPDNFTLTIKAMKYHLEGKYYVNVSNTHETKKMSFEVKVLNKEAPRIDKSVSIYNRKIGDSVDMSCRVIKGEPKPDIIWSFNKDGPTHDFEDLNNTQYFYRIEKINKHHSGIYRCEAKNNIDKDLHDMQLIVEYPLSIKVSGDGKFKEGDRVTLDCIVDGSPKPSIKWLFNGSKIEVSSRYKIYKNNSLSFKGSLSDNGNYYCEPENSTQKEKGHIRVTIYEPIWIKSPEETIFKLNVGEDKELQCHLIQGYPTPTINWQWEDFKEKVIPSIVKKQKLGKSSTLVLNKIQIEDQGYYICIADNNIEKKSIRYEVHVLAAPNIKKQKSRMLTGVVGDLTLIIKCDATGSPEPTIAWYTNGLNIAKGTEWYDIDNNGALIIKNLSLSSQGTYVCNASNTLNYDTVEYDVVVSEYVDTSDPKYSEKIVEGSNRTILCSHCLPYNLDYAQYTRWFKNGRFYKKGDSIKFYIAKRTDSGIYTCRISEPLSSFFCKTIVSVGSKPKFTSDARKIVYYKEGATEILDCNAIGSPELSVKWRHGSKMLPEKSMIYNLTMKKNNIGEYKCKVENTFGHIDRSFEIRNEACYLPKYNNYEENMPLILSHNKTWILQRAISLDENIYIFCPKSYLTYNKERLGVYIKAKCIEKTQFLFNNKKYDISNMKCKEKIQATYQESNITCRPGNTKLVEIRFSINTEVLSVFDVCIDKSKYKIHFTKYSIYSGISNTTLTQAKFDNHELLPLNFDDIYDCKKQLKSIYDTTGEVFSKDEQCCFGKRQLVSPMDVPPGLPQLATYSYLNVVPVWSSCGLENWDEVERRVRSLQHDLDDTLEIWSGASHSILLESPPFGPQELLLRDRYNKQQEVPLYLWKVVCDREEQASLAIILINYPNLTSQQALHLRRCKDVCQETNWMKNSEWTNVEKGFVFCCKIRDFENAFDYKKIFKGRNVVLRG